jgi:hypothetical protein
MATSKARRERRKHLQKPGIELDLHRRDQRVKQKALARRTQPLIQLIINNERRTYTLDSWKRDCPLKNRRDFQPFLGTGHHQHRRAA